MDAERESVPPDGAPGRPAALFFFVLPLLLVASAVTVRATRRVDAPAGVIARLRAHLTWADAASASEGVPLPLLLAVASAESAGRAGVRSQKRAVGLMQLLQGTADDMARRRSEPAPDLCDPATSLRLGARYLALQLRRYEGRAFAKELALCAYNAGPARVDGWLQNSRPESRSGGIHDWVPFQETRDYVRRVLAWETRWTVELGATAASD